jgi:hypothetical protein
MRERPYFADAARRIRPPAIHAKFHTVENLMDD